MNSELLEPMVGRYIDRVTQVIASEPDEKLSKSDPKRTLETIVDVMAIAVDYNADLHAETMPPAFRELMLDVYRDLILINQYSSAYYTGIRH